MKKLFIFLIFTGFYAVFAQQPNNSPIIPQGKWGVETISILEKGMPIPISSEKLNYEIPNEIEVFQEEVTFVYHDKRSTLDYNVAVRNNFLCFSLCAAWKIVDNIGLELKWEDDELGVVVLIFKQN